MPVIKHQHCNLYVDNLNTCRHKSTDRTNRHAYIQTAYTSLSAPSCSHSRPGRTARSRRARPRVARPPRPPRPTGAARVHGPDGQSAWQNVSLYIHIINFYVNRYISLHTCRGVSSRKWRTWLSSHIAELSRTVCMKSCSPRCRALITLGSKLPTKRFAGNFTAAMSRLYFCHMLILRTKSLDEHLFQMIVELSKFAVAVEHREKRRAKRNIDFVNL